MSWRHLLRSQLTQQHPHEEGLHDPPGRSSGPISHYPAVLKILGVAYPPPCSFKSPCPLPGTSFPWLISSLHPFGVPSGHSRGHQVTTPACVTPLLASLPLPQSHRAASTALYMFLSYQTVGTTRQGLHLLCIPRNQQINSSRHYCQSVTGIYLFSPSPLPPLQSQPPVFSS